MGREAEGASSSAGGWRSDARDLQANIAGLVRLRNELDATLRELRHELDALADEHPGVWLMFMHGT